MKKLITLSIFFGIMVAPVLAQLSLDGQIRPRVEFRDGYRQLPPEGSKPAAQVNQRTRLNLHYQHEDRVTTRISVQDLRIWGQERQMTTEPSFGLYEAWLELALTENFDIRAGRQELRYDNQRLMAINDWSLTGRTHDALLLKYETENYKLHIGSAFNQSHNTMFFTDYLIDNYKTLNYAWFNTNITPSLNLSLHGIADGYENPNDASELNLRMTWSSFLTYNPGNYTLRFNPAFQHGKTKSGQDISAFYAMIEAAYRVSAEYDIIAGFELFSGNDAEDPGDRFNAFSDLYGVGHGRNGFMDYFTTFPNHTQNAGLINPFLRNNFILSEKTLVSADLHLFFLQNSFIYDDKVVDKYLGTEVDLTLNYRFNDFTRILFGYSVMFGTESMEAIKGGSKDEFAHWAYVMIRMTPKFL